MRNLKLSKTKTTRAVQRFEEDQKDNGTEVALFNFVFNVASNLFHSVDPNISHIKISRFRKAEK